MTLTLENSGGLAGAAGPSSEEVRVQITVRCRVKGEHANVGDILTIPKYDAQYLVSIRKATFDIIEPEPPKPKREKLSLKKDVPA